MKAIFSHIVLLLLLSLNGLVCLSKDLPVLPFPQFVAEGETTLNYPAALRFTTVGLNRAGETRLTSHWKDFASELSGREGDPVTVVLGVLGKNRRFDEQIRQRAGARFDSIGREGYFLIMEPGRRVIAANTETGLFYGLQSLKQLTRSGWNGSLFIADWPAFAHRVIYDDISRGPISTIDYIKQQIERMAELKINYLSFYIEHVVQPVSYPDFAPANGKLTIPQIKALSAYAEKYHMQLIGSFQSFGHFEKILSLPQYRSMGETSTLISPLDPKAQDFLTKVIGELCDAFNAPYFNVNCDETFDLAKGKSKAYIDSIGPGRFYADHLRFLYDIVKRHGKRMMMWGDIALQHEEVLDMLPKDVIYLTWEYGDKESFDPWIAPFKKRNLEFMVCPGILNSYRMFPDMVMARDNIDGFLEAGHEGGATGAFTTIWDDGGTYLFSGDWYGVYRAAEKSWNLNTAEDNSFDSRYEATAYGTSDQRYVKALFKLMELRSVPVTYNLNDRLWMQKFIPDEGKVLIVDNSSAIAALEIIKEAERLIDEAKPVRNIQDIHTLKYSIEQYKLIMESRMQLPEIASLYQRAASEEISREEREKLLTESMGIAERLKSRYQQLQQVLRTAWLKENQWYWLDKVLEPYEEKINSLQELQSGLSRALRAAEERTALPAAASVRLSIRESPHAYFQYWLLMGSFPREGKPAVPDFLYASDPAYNKPPVAGDFIVHNDRVFRWQKFSSEDGGIVYLDENYKNPETGAAYAYCRVNAEAARSIDAFAAAGDGLEVYCNGERLLTDIGADSGILEERKIRLSLKKGANHILLKIPKLSADTPWAFSFRLDDTVTVLNTKYKYQLDPKIEMYETE